MRKWNWCLVVVLLCSFFLVTAASAKDGVTQIGFIDHADGTMTKVYEARTDRLMHQEEVKFLAYRTASEKSELTGKFVPKTRLESDPQAIGGMAWLGKGAAGFISNLPNAGGLIGMGFALRPATTNVSADGGTQSMSNSYKNWMAQGQGQVGINNQSQGQSTGAFSPVTVLP